LISAHLAGRDPGRLGIVAGQVGMVLPRQPSPGGLDLRRVGAGFDAENGMRIAL